MSLIKICPYCKKKFFGFNGRHCPNCDNIDFENIDTICLFDSETVYSTVTEEEFDPISSDFFSELDGWQHYETTTVEYEVPNGENYFFLIVYKNGANEYRKYHSSSKFAKKLLNHQKRFDVLKEVNSIVQNINDGFSKI